MLAICLIPYQKGTNDRLQTMWSSVQHPCLRLSGSEIAYLDILDTQQSHPMSKDAQYRSESTRSPHSACRRVRFYFVAAAGPRLCRRLARRLLAPQRQKWDFVRRRFVGIWDVG